MTITSVPELVEEIIELIDNGKINDGFERDVEYMLDQIIEHRHNELKIAVIFHESKIKKAEAKIIELENSIAFFQDVANSANKQLELIRASVK